MELKENSEVLGERMINQLKSIKRNWDSNMGVHMNLLRWLKKVPISYENKNGLGLAICNARLLHKKTREFNLRLQFK